MFHYHYAYKKIDEITDQNLQGLFDEIANHCMIIKEGLVIHFLEQALHPMGLLKNQKLDKRRFINLYYLPIKIRKLVDTEIYKLCIDIVAISRMGHIENFHGLALYSFINKAFPDVKKRKRIGG